MHEFARFIQAELDQRGWKQAELVRRSGLQRQHLSKLLNDKREHLGQMPDDGTITRLADGLELPRETVRAAAARALVGFVDDGSDLTLQLSAVSTDSLLTEIRRRIDASTAVQDEAQPGAPGSARKVQKSWVTDNLARLLQNNIREFGRVSIERIKIGDQPERAVLVEDLGSGDGLFLRPAEAGDAPRGYIEIRFDQVRDAAVSDSGHDFTFRLERSEPDAEAQADLISAKLSPGLDLSRGDNVLILNPDDEVTEEEFQTAARTVPGKPREQNEFEEHSAAGEGADPEGPEEGA